MARPRIEIDKNELMKIAKLQPTDAEVAAFFSISRDTWYERCKEDPEPKEILSNAREAHKISLRRLQWQAAENGSIPMMIWLGKQYLGQSDKQQVDAQVAESKSLFPNETLRTIAREVLRDNYHIKH